MPHALVLPATDIEQRTQAYNLGYLYCHHRSLHIILGYMRAKIEAYYRSKIDPLDCVYGRAHLDVDRSGRAADLHLPWDGGGYADTILRTAWIAGVAVRACGKSAAVSTTFLVSMSQACLGKRWFSQETA